MNEYNYSTALRKHVGHLNAVAPGTVAQAEMASGIRHNEPVIAAMDAFYRYAVKHYSRYETPLAEDYFLGPEWLAGIKAVRAMLNGEGDFDGGTMESLFWDAMAVAGFEESDL